MEKLEKPRLTSALRRFLTEDGADYDINQEVSDRAELLRRRNARHGAAGQFNFNSQSRDVLSWKMILGGIAESKTAEMVTIKASYNDFVKFIGQFIPQEIAASAAFKVYLLLAAECRGPARTDPSSGTSSKILGILGGTDGSRGLNGIKHIYKLVRTIENWRKAHNLEPLSPSSLDTEVGASIQFEIEQPKELRELLGLNEYEYESAHGHGHENSRDRENRDVGMDEEVPTIAGIQFSFDEDQFENAGTDESDSLMTTFRTLCSAISTLDISPEEIMTNIMTLLASSRRDEDLQSDLVDLIGFEHIELIPQLLSSRAELVSLLSSSSSSGASAASTTATTAAKTGPSSNFNVRSEAVMKLEKQRRRDARRSGRRQQQAQAYIDADIDEEDMKWLSKAGLLIDQSGALKADSSSTVKLGLKKPTLNDLLPEGTTSDSVNPSQRLLLPAGSIHNDKEAYEEVIVPAPESKFKPPPDGLVRISDFSEIGQKAFAGYKSLNPVQSRVFSAAYHTNENLLVAAPTGSGKTNIAMMCVLREVEAHFQSYSSAHEYKIIYVAPMKALASEVVRTFSSRLSALNVRVKELTGDMQMTKREIQETHMIVTTPEKWDVITRKSGDVALTSLVRLLVIDEVHLLENDRGSVIESIVARTLRQVETSQSMIRIVGLSATLPNYKDVAGFLRVHAERGLFYFSDSYRPVPLSQTIIGVKGNNPMQVMQSMNEVCYSKVAAYIRAGHQVMVFVHARNETQRTAMTMQEMAQNKDDTHLFDSSVVSANLSRYDIGRSRNASLRDMIGHGFGIHHAGMLRSDRRMVERLFADGVIKVLCCTATLAWGVNLPAHAVLIKGTKVYDAAKGMFSDLSMLDVMQIFGRAGRPQFDKSGEGTILTTHDQLWHYVGLMNHQLPIESHFIERLEDNLNAEVILGTVSNVEDAVQWLSYTYLYVRMLHNPLAYGIPYEEIQDDLHLNQRRRELIVTAAKNLDKAQMVVFHENSGVLQPTDLGRVSSYYYIQHESVVIYSELWRPVMTDAEILSLFAQSHEFTQVKIRDDEMEEMDMLVEEACGVAVKGGPENVHGKVNILLQAFISRAQIKSFSLISDCAYVSSNAGRIFRALFEFALKRSWTPLADRALTFCKMVEHRLWETTHPLAQFGNVLPHDIIRKLTDKAPTLEAMAEMSDQELGTLVNHFRMGPTIRKCVRQFPQLDIESSISPITRTVLRIELKVRADFEWNDRVHGGAQSWWIWVEDCENLHVYHTEYFIIRKQMMREEQKLTFTVPIFEPLPTQYHLRVVSDYWLGVESTLPLSFRHLILPERHPPHTELLDLNPLALATVFAKHPIYNRLYTRFTYLNPIQTQMFHVLYHTDHNVLVGAPTSSGKTLASELAMLRVFEADKNTNKKNKNKSLIVYIGPLKALVRERLLDWNKRFGKVLGKKIMELTGDHTPDMYALNNADVVLTTPEKWDGVSREWERRSYVQRVSLVVIDEIHLLGGDRGPILEVIVSRMRYIASQTDRSLRFVGLSTALANAIDLADWLGVPEPGLFNFRPSVRPIPLEVHISGFTGKHYCLAEDHQILTEVGFMFVDDFRTAVAQNPNLRVAAYNHVTGSFVYQKPSRYVINRSSTQDMIQFKQHVAAIDGGKDLPKAALLVTPEHDMFVLSGNCDKNGHVRFPRGSDYQKARADSLTDVDALKMLGHAPQGCVPTTVIDDLSSIPFVTKLKLNLNTEEKKTVFLEVFGYWLGDGSMSEKDERVLFEPRKKHDIIWVESRLDLLGVKYFKWIGKLQTTFAIPGWYSAFHDEYGQIYGTGECECDAVSSEHDIKSAKWFPYWAWRLGRDQVRHMLGGLQIADGETKDHQCIYTSSHRFRDEIVRMLLHAGYSAEFSLKYEAGADRSSAGKTIIAQHDHWRWRVSYRSDIDIRWSQPVFNRKRGDVKKVAYEGRTWCVTVPNGLIFARKAVADDSGRITEASTPLIVGNCPRMSTMNKPIYMAIATHSPDRPVLVFVSSRRQTRLTAVDLIGRAAADDQPRRFLKMHPEDLEPYLAQVKDSSLRDSLRFGIGLHHAGLAQSDKNIVEDLFARTQIQVLVSTSTLAWGVNLPAHLVIVKGTEYYDAPAHRYTDFPITDLLQMMGRAGRPQFDNQGVAVILAHEPKKNFYRKFLYEPFPVESDLGSCLHDHINAEIVSGTITTRQDAVDYLTWTYYFRRLSQNPSYYGLSGASDDDINEHLTLVVEDTMVDLANAGCILLKGDGDETETDPEVFEDGVEVIPLTLGRIASYYYLHYKTMEIFSRSLGPGLDVESLLTVLCTASEFDELPVRHNEDQLNEQLSAKLPWRVPASAMEQPWAKANLLLQAHMQRVEMPCHDYVTDLKSVMDQAVRVIQAIVDISADSGWLWTALNCMHLSQMISQAVFLDDPPLLTLDKDIGLNVASTLSLDSKLFSGTNSNSNSSPFCLPQLMTMSKDALISVGVKPNIAGRIKAACSTLPIVSVAVTRTSNSVSVALSRNACQKMSSAAPKAHTPRFPKPRNEGWWVVIGRPDISELVSVRRVILKSDGSKSRVNFDIESESGSGSEATELKVYLISDCYVGLDQEYSL